MRTERLVIRIEPELKAQLEAEAKRTGWSVSALVRDAIVAQIVSQSTHTI